MTSVLLPAPLGPTRPIISPGWIVRLMSSSIVAVAVTEADAAELDLALEPARVDRAAPARRRSGTRSRISKIRCVLVGGALRRLDHPAHRLEPDVEAADVELEADQHADVDRRPGRLCQAPNAQTIKQPDW